MPLVAKNTRRIAYVGSISAMTEVGKMEVLSLRPAVADLSARPGNQPSTFHSTTLDL